MTKKIIGILLHTLITFSIFAGGNSSGTGSITKQAAYKPRILVEYFSRADENYGVGVVKKGNTEIIAEMIAEETGADAQNNQSKAKKTALEWIKQRKD